MPSLQQDWRGQIRLLDLTAFPKLVPCVNPILFAMDQSNGIFGQQSDKANLFRSQSSLCESYALLKNFMLMCKSS